MFDTKNKIEYYCIVISFLIFMLISFFIFNIDSTTKFDLEIINFVQNMLCKIPLKIPVFITNFGCGRCLTILVVIFVLILTFCKKYKDAIILLIAMQSGDMMYYALKLFFARPRPPLDIRLIDVTQTSFPSGHSTLGMLFYGFLIYLSFKYIKNVLLRNFIIIFLCMMILSIGFTRIWLGVHYPSDVFGGFSLGIFLLSLWIVLDKIEWSLTVQNIFGKTR